MAMTMHLVFFLYLLASVKASDVFKLVHSSVQLDLQKTYKLSTDGTVRWLFNTDIGIVQYNGDSPSKVFQKYQGRVESNEKTHSLTLKNLQKSDSGLYEAEIFDQRREIVTKYHLYVLDPVEKPVLNVSQHKSNGTCYATFTCKTQYFSVTSNCYSNPCYNTTEKESGNTLLSLHVRNGTIVCNHSNPVSWETTEEIKHVKQLCLPEGHKEKSSFPSPFSYTLVTIPVSTGGLVIICIIIYFCYKKYYRTTEAGNTVYGEVEEGTSAVYCNVRKPPETNNDESAISMADPGNKNQEPEHMYMPLDTTHQSIYHTLNKK